MSTDAGLVLVMVVCASQVAMQLSASLTSRVDDAGHSRVGLVLACQAVMIDCLFVLLVKTRAFVRVVDGVREGLHVVECL